MDAKLWQDLIFGLLGGLAFFLYGMLLISNGLQKALGQKATKFLEKATNHPLKGIATGTAITMIFQSSSLTMVTLIGLINSGVLTLTPALGVMLGAEIGTTVTAQIVAFKVTHYALPIIALGFFMGFIPKRPNVRYVSQAIMGFGILFLGMTFMKEGVKPLESLPYFQEAVVGFGKVPLWGMLIGAAFTGIIQSSSATTGLVIAMATEGIIGIEVAVPLILGANIGTTVTGFLASLNSQKAAKKLSYAQVIFNVLGVATIMFFVSPYINFIKTTSGDIGRQIANAHTIFNAVSAAIGILFIKELVGIVEKIVPGKELEQKNGTKFLDPILFQNPSIALVQSQKEIYEMARIVKNMSVEVQSLYKKYDKEMVRKIVAFENNVDFLYRAINQYLTELTSKALSVENSERITTQIHVISDIERVGDHFKNIAFIKRDLQEKNIKVSKDAQKEIAEMLKLSIAIFEKSSKVIKKEDKEALAEIKEIEAEIDRKEQLFQINHMARMKKGECKSDADVPFVSILRNIERAGDHSNNIAHEILIYNHVNEVELVH